MKEDIKNEISFQNEVLNRANELDCPLLAAEAQDRIKKLIEKLFN